MSRKYLNMSFGKGADRITLSLLHKPWKMGLAGMITSKEYNHTIPIIADDEVMNRIETDFACIAYTAADDIPRLYMEENLFQDFKRGVPMARAVVLHELGHLIAHDRGLNGYMEERVTAAEHGNVFQMEAAADSFAVRCLGKESVITGFQVLADEIKRRYSGDEFDRKSVDASVGEIEIRIDYIRKNL